MPRKIYSILFALSLAFGCGDAERSTTDTDVIHVSLLPGETDGDARLRWSPKGASVALSIVDGSLEGTIVLGSEHMSPFAVRLSKTEGSDYFDELWIDANRDGTHTEDELLRTSPREVRYAMWSSFDTTLSVPVSDPDDGSLVMNPYPLALWYVESLREETTDHALRFSRRGWMQGRAQIDGVDAHIRLSESELDGVFTQGDEWTLALPDSVHNLFAFEHDRPATRHAWLGEKAYEIVDINPTGRSISIAFIDPGVTREKEAQDDDKLAVDRQAPHSGGMVNFSRDFASAEQEARESGKSLFIDFDAVWCGPCKQMDEWVYTADSVVEAAENMIAVKVDGDDYPELAKRFNVVGFPTMIRVNPDGEIVNRLWGYQSVETMTAFLTDASAPQADS